MRVRVPLVAAFLALACLHSAQADRSRLGADADEIEAGDCEVETTLARQTRRGAGPERETSIELACGVGFRTEVTLSAARRRGDGGRETERALEGKTTLTSPADAGVGLALGYGASAVREQHSAWRSSEHFVVVAASYRLSSDWATEAKLGTARQRAARHDSTIWLLAVEHALIAELLEARVELSGDDRDKPKLELSLRYTIRPESVSLKLASGIQAGPQRARQVRLGLIVEF